MSMLKKEVRYESRSEHSEETVETYEEGGTQQLVSQQPQAITQKKATKTSTKTEAKQTHKEQVDDMSNKVSAFHISPGGSGQYRIVEVCNIPLTIKGSGSNVAAEIRTPSKLVDKPLIEDNQDGTINIKYTPREEGKHELPVKINNQDVPGSPFSVFIGVTNSPGCAVYGTGIIHGRVGYVNTFTINTTNAGSGNVKLSIAGPTKTAVCLCDNKDGTMTVSYVPSTPGEYKFSIIFADLHVPGSPYTVKITGGDKKNRSVIAVNIPSEIILPGKFSVEDMESGGIFAALIPPNGTETPCFLKRLPNGNLAIQFKPAEIGEHSITVTRKQTILSTFKLLIAEKAVKAVKKVHVSGPGLEKGVLHAENEVIIDQRKQVPLVVCQCRWKGQLNQKSSLSTTATAPPLSYGSHQIQEITKYMSNLQTSRYLDHHSLLMFPTNYVHWQKCLYSIGLWAHAAAYLQH